MVVNTVENQDDISRLLDGYALSFVVPTKTQSCNYGCPMCIFALQNKKKSPRMFEGELLTPEKIHDILETFTEASTAYDRPVVLLAVQGIQPFADEVSVAMVREIFSWSEYLAAPCSFVSSGDGVPENIDLIASVRASGAFSIDADRKTNARVRPAVLPDRNSWDMAIRAMDAMVEVPELQGFISVACAVMPGRTDRPLNLVRTFPERLRPHVEFIFAPYISIGGKNKGKVGITREEFLRCIDELRRITPDEGITMAVDDEDNDLKIVSDVDVPQEIIIPRPPMMTMIRIYPNGKMQHDGLLGSKHSVEDSWFTLETMGSHLIWKHES